MDGEWEGERGRGGEGEGEGGGKRDERREGRGMENNRECRESEREVEEGRETRRQVQYNVMLFCTVSPLYALFMPWFIYLVICIYVHHAAKGLSISVSGRIRYLEVENDGPDKPQDDRGPPVHDVCGVDVHQLYLK